MKCVLAIAGLMVILCAGAIAPAAQAECRAPEAPRLHVRFAGETAREVLLESIHPAGLRLVDAVTQRELWSAAPDKSATQTTPDMNWPLGSSFTAVHLDADGLHDRIYAGDQAGRLWRLDLHAGAKPSEWMRPILLADFSAAGGGRGFIAAPDITRIKDRDGRSWLSIAIGTANTGPVAMEQRFYVIRDSLRSDTPARPLAEADLEPVTTPQGTDSDNGYYLRLGSAQIVARALTLNGVTHFSTVEGGRNLLEGCAQGIHFHLKSVRVGTVEAVNGALVGARDGATALTLWRTLGQPAPADASVELATAPDSSGRLLCHIAGESLPACFVDTRPRRTWWRREDAD